MPISKLIEYKCDLCGQRTARFKDATEAADHGWMVLNFKHHLGHKSYFDRVVCSNCSNKMRPILARRIVAFDGTWAVYLERCRQCDEEGFTLEHDDDHEDGALARAAAAILTEQEDAWGLYRKHKGDRKRCLEIAGALVCAEWDRLKRIEDRVGSEVADA